VCTQPTSHIDQEWLDALNAERKKEQLNKISYEAFEIVMDRLEKEWFDLVCVDDASSFSALTVLATDEEHPETRPGFAF
jgi:hypothetical protein